MKEKLSSLAALDVMVWNVGEVAGREDVEMAARSGRYSRYLQTCCILFSKTFSTSVLEQMTFSTIQKLRWIPWSLQIVRSYFLVDLTTSLQRTSWGISPGLSFLHKILTPPGEAHACQVSQVSTQEHFFIFASEVFLWTIPP
jgi:hypothetical protein